MKQKQKQEKENPVQAPIQKVLAVAQPRDRIAFGAVVKNATNEAIVLPTKCLEKRSRVTSYYKSKKNNVVPVVYNTQQ